MQGKLLRGVEDRRVRALGDRTTYEVDVRFICATNRPLADMAAAGAFRSDLYHRLAVFELHLPPLRERGRDVIMVALYILKHDPCLRTVQPTTLGTSGEQFLLSWPWPGNVRELRNVLIRAAILAQGRPLDKAILQAAMSRSRPAEPVAAPVALPSPSSASAGEAAQAEREVKWRDRMSGRKRSAGRGQARPPSVLDLTRTAEQVHAFGPRVLRLALDRGRIQRADVVEATELSERTADRVLAGLVEARVLDRDGGKGNAGGYVVVGRRGA